MVQSADLAIVESRYPKVPQSLHSHWPVSAPRHIRRKVGHTLLRLSKISGAILYFFVVEPQGKSHLEHQRERSGWKLFRTICFINWQLTQKPNFFLG